VDAALMFNFFYSVEPADRQALFQQLYSQMAPNGIAITLAEISGPTSGLMRLMERLGNPSKGLHDEVERDMLAAGFSLVYTQDIEAPEDLSNPSDDLVKYIQILAYNKVGEHEVRAAMAEVFGSGEPMSHTKMGIFRK